MEAGANHSQSIATMLEQEPITYPVIDARIVGTTMADALEMVMSRAETSAGGYACFVNAHVSVMTRQEPKVRSAIASATYAFPDGMPVYLVGKYLHGLDIEKISGPDVMEKIFESERGRKLRHYFYGSTPEVLEKLTSSLQECYPGSNIVGAVSPPFRELSDEEQTAQLNAIRSSGAQLVWVGLGAPKQEYWMKANTSHLPKAVLLGVGAAFDFHAGTIKRAPEWARRLGFEWLHRLLQEPKRLWKRYSLTNSLFILWIIFDKFSRT